MQAIRDHAEIRADAEKLADIFTTLERCFLMNLSRELARGKVSFPQYFLLGFLAQQKFLTMSEIALKMGHTTAAATGLVDRLENLGYARRIHDSEDRRKIMVEITESGLSLVAGIREDMIDGVMRLMVHLSVDEQKAWLQIYEKVMTVWNVCK